MNAEQIKQFSNAVSKRNADKIIDSVVCTVQGNIDYDVQSLRKCEEAITSQDRRYKYRVACQFDNHKWVDSHVGTGKEELNGLLNDDVRDFSRDILNESQYNRNALVFNWGYWYGKPLNKKGISEMKNKLYHTNNFVRPNQDGLAKPLFQFQ